MFIRRKEFEELKDKVTTLVNNDNSTGFEHLREQICQERTDRKWWPNGGQPTIKGRIVAIEKFLGIQVVNQEADTIAVKEETEKK